MDPNGLDWEFMKKANKDNNPSDASAIIEMDMELDQLQLNGARNFYNDMFGVMGKYKVTKSNHELCVLMVCKNQNVLYAQLILDELKSNSANCNRLCSNVSKIQ